MTPAGPVAAHVYVRPESVPFSDPKTVRAVKVPVTGLGVAAAGVATAGPMVIVAVPLAEPAVALMVAAPAVAGAVYRPKELLMLPTPLTSDQAKTGNGAIGAPNWSVAVALKTVVALAPSEAVDGLTVIVVGT